LSIALLAQARCNVSECGISVFRSSQKYVRRHMAGVGRASGGQGVKDRVSTPEVSWWRSDNCSLRPYRPDCWERALGSDFAKDGTVAEIIELIESTDGCHRGKR
jgi:hypothetical protein